RNEKGPAIAGPFCLQIKQQHTSHFVSAVAFGNRVGAPISVACRVTGRLIMGVMTVANLEDYFRDSLRRATEARAVAAHEATQHYLVHMLAGFARAENLFVQGAEGTQLRPLALMLSDALDEQPGPERNLMLRRLGDVALFIAGFFGDSLVRKSVDVDYYSKMGEAAYSTLCNAPASRRDLVLVDVYAELA